MLTLRSRPAAIRAPLIALILGLTLLAGSVPAALGAPAALGIICLTANTTLPVGCYQPDGRIRLGSGPWRGNNMYTDYPVPWQMEQARIKGGHGKNFYVTVQNDGLVPDSFRVAGSTDVGSIITTIDPMKVRYFRGYHGAEITDEIVAGTFVTPVLDPGQKFLIRVRASVLPEAAPGLAMFSYLAMTSVEDTSKVDVVTLLVLRRPFLPPI